MPTSFYRYRPFNEFTLSEIINQHIFLPVIYPSKRKKEGTFKFLPADNQMKCGAVFNSIVKFEKEWRVIQYVDDDNNHYVDWNMSDIYLGYDISDESEEIIKNILIRNGLKIALHKMNLSPIGLESTDISNSLSLCHIVKEKAED